MKYISERDIRSCNFSWDEIILTIRQAVLALAKNDFAQPVKPYLRFNNPNNRIIAMPAFVGGSISCAGIKWIASFPENIHKQLPRAHAVFVLNDTETGVPYCIINSGTLSGIRTAGVSGLMIEEFLKRNPKDNLKVGITGFGPIGRLHYEMIKAVLGNRLSEVRVYDPGVDETFGSNAFFRCKNWEEAFDDADIFITCTVSKERYINRPPQKGSLHLNVSLRDYFPTFRKHIDIMIVDSWDEICRENTDIQKMNDQNLLSQQDVIRLDEFISKSLINQFEPQSTIMFNPMGMAVFDMAVGKYFYKTFSENGTGVELE